MRGRFALAGISAGLFLMLSVWAVDDAAARNITLRWTATGDDGGIGTAALYELRWSTTAITSGNFAGATLVAGLPLPRAAGTLESFTVTGLPDLTTCYFAMRVRDDVGNWSALSNVSTLPGQTVGVDDTTLTLSFSRPMPNPTRTSARFTISLPRSELVQVQAFDLAGRRIKVLVDGVRQPGQWPVVWDLTDDSGLKVEPGIYLVRGRAADQTWTWRVSVVK